MTKIVCARCHTRTAAPAQDSRFRLCDPCGRDVCPGSSVVLYQALLAEYGYAR